VNLTLSEFPSLFIGDWLNGTILFEGSGGTRKTASHNVTGDLRILGRRPDPVASSRLLTTSVAIGVPLVVVVVLVIVIVLVVVRLRRRQKHPTRRWTETMLREKLLLMQDFDLPSASTAPLTMLVDSLPLPEKMGEITFGDCLPMIL
jgi:hypothetical protein